MEPGLNPALKRKKHSQGIATVLIEFVQLDMDILLFSKHPEAT